VSVGADLEELATPDLGGRAVLLLEPSNKQSHSPPQTALNQQLLRRLRLPMRRMAMLLGVEVAEKGKVVQDGAGVVPLNAPSWSHTGEAEAGEQGKGLFSWRDVEAAA
jgi:hypothetical protein